MSSLPVPVRGYDPDMKLRTPSLPRWLRGRLAVDTKKMTCGKHPDHDEWDVHCPCCGVGWYPTSGDEALALVRSHVDAHGRTTREVPA
jgi:hypothetical protein